MPRSRGASPEPGLQSRGCVAPGPSYLDRNYGAVLIRWDRLFGTFAEERETPIYGTTKPLASFNPLRAQAHEWVQIARQARTLRGLDRVAIWWRSPSWSAAGRPLSATAQARVRSALGPPLPRSQKLYAAAQFAPLVPALIALLVLPALPLRMIVPAASFILWTLLSLGGLLDDKRWAFPLEMARLASLAAWAVGWAPRS